MSLYMAEVGGVYVFIADDEITAIRVDSEKLEAKPAHMFCLDTDVELIEISPLR